MDDVLQYAGKRVVLTGSASGMGAAAAEILTDLGAEVIGLDVQPTETNVKESILVDLRDEASIDAAVEAIGGPVDSVFSVAGLPGAPFSDLDTMLVNVFGAKHLIESLVPVIPEGGAVVCVASNAGLGWEDRLDRLLPPVQLEGFAAGKAWCEQNPKAILGGYGPSKEMSNAWVAWRAPSLLTEHGIRLNLTNPGPTTTAMMPKFEDQVGAAMIDAFIGPGGRRSTAEEQAWAMVFLNSPRSSYVAGESFHVDAGFRAAMLTDQLEIG
jgi:NAD(P)-dependent dehydrogenase (short-subunit alcohol dehydrogenase family)